MSKFVKVVVLLMSLLGAWSGEAYAAACTSIANSNWNILNTWGAFGTGCAGAGTGPGETANIPGVNDTVTIATNVTLDSARSVTDLTVNLGATLNPNARTLTISGDITINGTVNDPNAGANGILQSTGNAAVVSGSGGFTGEARLYFAGTGPSIAAGSTLNFAGTTQIRAGRNGGATATASVLTINGTITSTQAAGTAILGLYANSTIIGVTGVINAAPSTIDYQTNAATLINNGSVTIHDVVDTNNTNVWTNAAGSTLNVSGALMATSGGVLTATATGNTVNYNGTAQTAKVTTYDNLTLSGSGAKTFATTPTVNNVLSMEGTATVAVTTGVVTYGANATLQYKTTNARTASAEEWITPFAATGGVIIANTAGSITLNGAKFFNASVPLTINSGTTLITNNLQLTFGGDFVNNGGTFIAGSSNITITNTMANQSIAGFTTTGTVSVTKTAGTATLTGNVTGSALTLTNNGIVATGANVLDVTSSCVAGITRTGGYVVGNLSLHYPAGTNTCTFPIGDAANYTPVTVAMANVTSSLANSVLTVRADPGDHPDTPALVSGIDPGKSVNRYWTLTPGALTFATYNATFSFVNGDIDVGATFSNFIIGRKSGVWTYPTMGAKNPNNATATGITQANGFGVFAIGERAIPGITVAKSVTTYFDPVNNTTNPKAIPGAEMLYTTTVTNSGPGSVDADTTMITDTIPANTVMCVSTLCNNPVMTFTCSASPACGLTFNYPASVTYSCSSLPCPQADANGFGANVTSITVNPSGTFNGALSPQTTNFSVIFKVKIK